MKHVADDPIWVVIMPLEYVFPTAKGFERITKCYDQLI